MRITLTEARTLLAAYGKGTATGRRYRTARAFQLALNLSGDVSAFLDGCLGAEKARGTYTHEINGASISAFMDICESRKSARLAHHAWF